MHSPPMHGVVRTGALNRGSALVHKGGPELGRPYHSLIIHFVTAVTVLQFSKSLSHTLKYFYINIYKYI